MITGTSDGILMFVTPSTVSDFFGTDKVDLTIELLKSSWEKLNDAVFQEFKIKGQPEELPNGLLYVPMKSQNGLGEFDSALLIRQNDMLTVMAFLGTQENIKTLAENIEPAGDNGKPDYSSLKTGDVATLGSYEQDNDLNNGPEPIEWKVLTVENRMALLLSTYALDAKQFHTNSSGFVTWEGSSLRKWMNDDFFNTAFSPDEKAYVSQSVIANPANKRSGASAGNKTTDRIFLLSTDEVNEYFESEDARICEPTEYAKAAGAQVSYKYTSWCLRTPVITGMTESIVDGIGWITSIGAFLDDATRTVRPAFWLDMNGSPSGSDNSDKNQSAAGSGTVTTDDLLRTEPSFSGTVIRSILYGTNVEIMESKHRMVLNGSGSGQKIIRSAGSADPRFNKTAVTIR